jgi:hypothetical protein
VISSNTKHQRMETRQSLPESTSERLGWPRYEEFKEWFGKTGYLVTVKMPRIPWSTWNLQKT